MDKKDECKKYKDIELRSEEVQEVMGQVPPAILLYGSGVLLCIVMWGAPCSATRRR